MYLGNIFEQLKNVRYFKVEASATLAALKHATEADITRLLLEASNVLHQESQKFRVVDALSDFLFIDREEAELLIAKLEAKS